MEFEAQQSILILIPAAIVAYTVWYTANWPLSTKNSKPEVTHILMKHL